MQSFRTELEDINNPVVQQDIITLEKQIRLFREGSIDDDKFRSLRLSRGIYGQRQTGVQMVRIKLPFGSVTTRQLRRIADISDEYASSNLHATTRQDIQIHHVSLDRTPELWSKLEEDSITIREACGNTVRNVTASATAGVDPHEPFDVSPYAYETFKYFLRNPVCQDMGRKFKISFSSSDEDTAYAFIHDIGFIPKIRDGERGFKVVIGGGLGAVPYLALPAFDFMHEDEIIPFAESVLRVFDRYGERTRRMKARFKFLLDNLGLEKVMELVEAERTALSVQRYKIDRNALPEPVLPRELNGVEIPRINEEKFTLWKKTNVFEQKQDGYFGVYVRLPLGNLSSASTRVFADIVDKYASNELRITVNQGYLIRFVREKALPHLFAALDKMALAEPGFDSVGDITACPGTDTCNLGISSSYGIAIALEKVINEEYPDLIHNNDIKIKISGCPNSCGQHGLASIGFHGSSIKDKKGGVLPALVVLLGGGKLADGEGLIAEKVLKIPSRRGIAALRLLLDDYDTNSNEGEYYHVYYQRIGGRKYFYDLLKPLGDITSIEPGEYIDWGEEHNFILHTATGECAGVIIDLVATLLYETEEKLAWAKEARDMKHYADSIYHSYSAFINTAKALLLTNDIRVSTQIQVLDEFQKNFVENDGFPGIQNFREFVLRINKNEPTEAFALQYLNDSSKFLQDVNALRQSQRIAVEAK
jgi:sulfite reductase (ferredoxin)